MNALGPALTSRAMAGDPLPVCLELPELSVQLRVLIHGILDSRPPKCCGSDLRTEAASVISNWDAACKPVSVSVVVAWLRSINLASDVPVQAVEFVVRAAAIAEALEDFPLGVFTRQTRRMAQQEFKYFPGSATIATFLRGGAGKLKSTLRALRIIVDLPPPPPPEPQPTSTERLAVLAARQAVIDEFHRKLREAGLYGGYSKLRVSSSHDPDETPQNA